MSVLVASTVAPYKCIGKEATAWLEHAHLWKEQGHEFFCAVEQRWDTPEHVLEEGFADLITGLLDPLGAEVWRFKLDNGETTLTTGGRLVRITTGRNLAHELLNRNPGRWEGILFIDTDVEPPPDAPERLLEVDHPLVGFNVPTYCLDGPRVRWRAANGLSGIGENVWVGDDAVAARHNDDSVWTVPMTKWGTGEMMQAGSTGGFGYKECPFPEGADVREHWNTAGALLVREEAARRLRWRYDLSRGMTDDPCFQADAVELGFGQTWVRHDVVGRHHPETITGLEARGLDLSL